VSLSPTADWQFRHTPEKSKRWTERRGGGLGRNEGEAERFRVVEIAQRYDLDRVYNGEISGWQSHKENERSEHRQGV